MPVVEHADQGLDMALRLHVAAHHAETHLRLAIAGEKGGNDGVERPLVRADLIRMACGVDKTGATVLQTDAAGRHHA